MAYTRTSNIPVGKTPNKRYEDENGYTWIVDHYFSAEVGTNAAQEVNALIESQQVGGVAITRLSGRTGLTIANNDTAVTLYVGFSSATSTTNYKWALTPGNAVHVPARANVPVYVFAASAVETSITEVW